MMGTDSTQPLSVRFTRVCTKQKRKQKSRQTECCEVHTNEGAGGRADGRAQHHHRRCQVRHNHKQHAWEVAASEAVERNDHPQHVQQRKQTRIESCSAAIHNKEETSQIHLPTNRRKRGKEEHRCATSTQLTTQHESGHLRAVRRKQSARTERIAQNTAVHQNGVAQPEPKPSGCHANTTPRHTTPPPRKTRVRGQRTENREREGGVHKEE
jgi:hypothetical protein